MAWLVLVVDDHEDTGEALRRMIRMQGYRAMFVPSGAHAIEWLAEHTPDLMILDVMMPGSDGLGVLRLVRSEPRLAKVPVIIYSAISDREFRDYAIREGASAYWVKGSFDYGEFSQMLASVLPSLLPGAPA